MRVAAVSVYGNDRRVLGDQVCAAKSLSNPLLHLELGGAAVAHAMSNLFKGSFDDRVYGIARGKVSFDLLVAPGSFKARHQVAGADDLFAKAAHQFHGTGIHQPD